MSAALHLSITTPSAVLIDQADIVSLRAEDESGGFGILPGHADLLTVLRASVVRWHARDDIIHYCVVRSGVLTVTEGQRIAIACRQGTTGDDLTRLEEDVAAMRAEEVDAGRRARVEQLRLHAHAVRQLMHYLHPGQTVDAEIMGAAVQDTEEI
ncbi:F0F1 ATP synthase subunit epsilon [Beijerinckia indica]|uniref:ATP synthase epsilon chain n=1 Tax=Beijerinckia indica subsp. indica (strain ATCC 9039 / DSM 1715 / NCIMB 8712) TaxID=395963 RepID=B2IJX1_BEII9|nr:F0F1 ATP synthase subunit epsilon [Beijerinckia indica]ACB96346.1 alternate F1F0 ATPase, F1 subunit epsilon [Beijerinckia indica subsp. indica ATCC 9039]